LALVVVSLVVGVWSEYQRGSRRRWAMIFGRVPPNREGDQDSALDRQDPPRR
jgi:hypothetical protein